MTANNHVNVLIIGGGCAGISVATRIKHLKSNATVAIVEPSDTAYYQAAWTLVGAGAYDAAATRKSMQSVMPSGVTWVKAYAESFDPDNNQVATSDGTWAYDTLVVCPGLKLNFDGVEGLSAALGKNQVCTNYTYEMAQYTWQCLQGFESGTALFTEPPMPIKCAGAPQKIAYLAADNLRQKRALADCHLEYACAKPVIFGVPYFQKPLNDVCDDYGIERSFGHNLVAIDGEAKEAVFKVTPAEGEPQEVVKPFDFIHVTPPQTAPDFIKASPLADEAGWVDVDHQVGTLRHARYANVYSLGDVMNAPNAKTGAAVRKLAPVVAQNVVNHLNGVTNQDETYDGYGACPLTVSYGKVMLAEFVYGGVVTPSMPFDPKEPRKLYWQMKSKLFPFLQWNVMFKGRNWSVPGHAPLATDGS